MTFEQPIKGGLDRALSLLIKSSQTSAGEGDHGC